VNLTPNAEVPLLAWLVTALQPMSRTSVKQLLRDGCVVVNGVPVTQFDHVVRPGDAVTVGSDGPAPALKAQIVFEDDHLIVMDKPAGLLTVSTESEKKHTAFAMMREFLARREERPFVVHRLDRETSGVLVFARSAAVRDKRQASWPSVTKTYLAVVEGVPSPPVGVVESFLAENEDMRVRVTGTGDGAKWAVTRYRVLGERRKWSMVEVGLETGRKHQIRVHLAGMGCPVIGDKMYGAKTDPVKRMGLHAWRLAFDHPANGKRVEIESPWPAALRNVGK